MPHKKHTTFDNYRVKNSQIFNRYMNHVESILYPLVRAWCRISAIVMNDGRIRNQCKKCTHPWNIGIRTEIVLNRPKLPIIWKSLFLNTWHIPFAVLVWTGSYSWYFKLHCLRLLTCVQNLTSQSCPINSIVYKSW